MTAIAIRRTVDLITTFTFFLFYYTIYMTTVTITTKLNICITIINITTD